MALYLLFVARDLACKNPDGPPRLAAPLGERQMLTADLPAPSCTACVIVPVRNEQARLAGALHSLLAQRDLDGKQLPRGSYEVLLLLNNCTDGSVAIAQRFRAEHPQLSLKLIERQFPAAEAHAGTARRALMDEAYRRLIAIGRPQALILSTDADTRVAPDWIAQNMREIHAGADAVGGQIEMAGEDRRRLDSLTQQAYLADQEYHSLLSRLETLLDPVPWDEWPRHDQHFGASLCCTAAAYEKAGGMPAAPMLEDVAFYDALVRVDARFRHSTHVRVVTAGRLRGRASVGFAWQLRIWKSQSRTQGRHCVENGAFWQNFFTTRSQLRRLYAGVRSASHQSILKQQVAAALGLSNDKVQIDRSVPFGQFLEDLRFAERIRKNWPESRRIDAIESVVAELRLRNGALSRVTTLKSSEFTIAASPVQTARAG